MPLFTNSPGFEIGQMHYQNGGVYGPVLRPFFVIFVIYSGEAVIIADNQAITVRANEAAFIAHRHSLEVRMPSRQHTHIAWCETYDDNISKKEWAQLQKIPSVIPLAEPLREIYGLALSCAEQSEKSQQSVVNALCVALFQAYKQATDQLTGDKPLPAPLERAVRFIEQHFAETLSTGTLADAALLSTSQLTKLFKQFLNTTPQKYLWRVRTEKGVYLLKYSGLSIAEIADQCGFKNQYHFSRLVTEYFHSPPSRLRKQHWFSESVDPSTISDIHF
ncbi:helix-turn-helix domain-containing protein [Halioxenophilus sp. WMMB6]|uniref:helix-turn-helix domain-containing protein n=1 Tax=Halioxenophilus sp. WMMB6 TaxID=3073815 RepID=UPI00295E5225|nr:helix-turn-helix domain-containing protein [Halioxenophilus sp. WMMB6]